MTLELWGGVYDVKSQVSVQAGRAKSYRLWIEIPNGELVAVAASREEALNQLTEIVDLLNAQQKARDKT